LLLGGVGLFLLLELELAIVHDPADRRVGVGLDFHQVHASLFGHGQGLGAGQDARLFALGVNHAYPRDADILVAAVALVVDGADSQFLRWMIDVRQDQAGIDSALSRSMNAWSGIAPRSSPPRVRTAMAPCSFSRSPATSR